MNRFRTTIAIAATLTLVGAGETPADAQVVRVGGFTKSVGFGGLGYRGIGYGVGYRGIGYGVGYHGYGYGVGYRGIGYGVAYRGIGYPGFAYRGLGYPGFGYRGFSYGLTRPLYGSFYSGAFVGPVVGDRYLYGRRLTPYLGPPVITASPRGGIVHPAPYRAARPPVLIDDAVDLPSSLRIAALRLEDNLRLRPDDADVWLDYLRPRDIVAAIDNNDPNAVAGLLERYQGVTGNASLGAIWSTDAFRRIYDLLPQYLQASPGADFGLRPGERGTNPFANDGMADDGMNDDGMNELSDERFELPASANPIAESNAEAPTESSPVDL